MTRIKYWMGNTSATNITMNIYIHRVQEAVITLRTKLSSAVYCYRSCLWQAACLWVGLLPRKLEIVCIDLHQTGSVGKGRDHLQLIKFWQSCATGKGVCGGAKIFGSALLQPACSVCIWVLFSLSLNCHFPNVSKNVSGWHCLFAWSDLLWWSSQQP